mgnify:CR=1 FL=1
METYTLYQMLKKGLLLNRKCKPIVSFIHLRGIVDSWGYTKVDGEYHIRKVDIDDHNERMRKVVELLAH